MEAVDFSCQLAGLRNTLKGFTRRFTTNLEESHDLVQDTLLRALMYRDKFREDTNLKGWLFTIMRNTFINNYRKDRRVRMMRDKTEDLYYLNIEERHTFNRPQESFEFDEIWNNVNRLKDELLVPFKMYSSGYKYHEIAAHLDIPIGTVKNRIFHARKEIQKRLQGY